MKNHAQVRSAEAIFNVLKALCQEPGFLHAISKILLRDFYVSIDRGGKVAGKDHWYRRSKLNHNELMLLVGLLCQSNDLDVMTTIGDAEDQVRRADELLEEFHQALEKPMRDAIRATVSAENSSTKMQSSRADWAKEAIYYGADAATYFQYLRFARNRYRNDLDWMLATYGISIRPIIEMANGITNQIDLQMSGLLGLCKEEGRPPEPAEISNALIFDKGAFRKAFGAKSDRFVELFCTPINNANAPFTSPFSLNQTSFRPLIDLGAQVFVADQFKLAESIYESPYYWMLSDANYKDAASENRGNFLEDTIHHLLTKVFGDQNVFKNVIIERKKGEVAAEADILVVYGEFILVFQAKSKRLTSQARAGDIEKIESDFQDAVQSAYDQAVAFSDLLSSGAECITATGIRRRFEFLARVFPIVVLSDHFPSLSILSNKLIRLQQQRFPAIFDIFFLEVFSNLLNEPVEFLYYLQQRTRYFERLHSNSELSLLGFHLKQKLYISDEYDFVDIGDDFASDLEDYILAKELGRPSNIQFPRLEERAGVPAIAEIISYLKNGPPQLAGIAIELLDFSGDSLSDIAARISEVRSEVQAGKRLKAFSIQTHYGGLSYVAVRRFGAAETAVAEAIAYRHKYKSERDRWYILVDVVDSTNLIDAALPIWEAWSKTPEQDAAVEEVDKQLKTTSTSRGNAETKSNDD